jgi:hypothetical protein
VRAVRGRVGDAGDVARGAGPPAPPPRGGVLGSRPYRLTVPVESDVEVVERKLGVGAVMAAVAAYAGPLLPGSGAPAVVRLRRRLADGLRAALVSGRDPDLLADWAHAPWGEDDLDAWRALAAIRPTPPVRARLEELEAEQSAGRTGSALRAHHALVDPRGPLTPTATTPACIPSPGPTLISVRLRPHLRPTQMPHDKPHKSPASSQPTSASQPARRRNVPATSPHLPSRREPSNGGRSFHGRQST